MYTTLTSSTHHYLSNEISGITSCCFSLLGHSSCRVGHTSAAFEKFDITRASLGLFLTAKAFYATSIRLSGILTVYGCLSVRKE